MNIESFYKKYFNIKSPFKHQIDIWELVKELKFPILLRAPTGSGKTEAVLAQFLSQFIDKKYDIAPRMIYCLIYEIRVACLFFG